MRHAATLALGFALFAAAPAAGQSVTTYHGSADRSGLYIVPGLTVARAANAALDPGFRGAVDGHVYAQPLYWQSRNLLVVATESNVVQALDATTGREAWRAELGPAASRRSLPCGNIDPLGVTGTPVIDPAAGALYLDAVVERQGEPRHLVFGLSLADGRVLPGWPIDIAQALAARGLEFAPRAQNQRGALVLAGGRLFVPFGGHFGDCGRYHGWVVGFDLARPALSGAWSTRAAAGGIWAPGGVAVDGADLFVATGNTEGAAQWGDGEAILRLHGDLGRSSDARDYFAPADWRQLDDADTDLGGTNPLPFDVGGRRLLLALGKDGNAYLLDRANLGGIGGALATEPVARGAIVTAPARVPVGDGMLVALRGRGAMCPGSGGSGLIALRIAGGARPSVGTAWCAALDGRGSPIVTTPDGHSDAIVWIAGAEGDDRLHGFRADTGQPVFAGGGPTDRMAGLRRFATILAAAGRLYVAGDGRLYAVRFGG